MNKHKLNRSRAHKAYYERQRHRTEANKLRRLLKRFKNAKVRKIERSRREAQPEVGTA